MMVAGVHPRSRHEVSSMMAMRLQSETTPEGGTVSYTYTANDLVATVTNERGKVITYSYNTRNLVTGISYNDRAPAVGFQYDDYGVRTQMSDGEGTHTYTYSFNFLGMKVGHFELFGLSLGA